jgi:hypothetical protein
MKLPAFCILILATLNLQASETGDPPARPKWHVRTQFAGFQGLLSAGGGPVLAKGVWRPALMYGYAPPLNERARVHQFILRNDIVLFPRMRLRDPWVSPFFSANLLLETGDHTYLKLPDQFPRGYYHPPQVHGTFGAGARLNKITSARGPFKEITFSTEFVALDTYLWYAISQRGAPLHRAFGLSFALGAAW